MSSLPVGFFMLLAFILFSAESGSWSLYMNSHAILIVCGGTISILAFSTPNQTLVRLAHSLMGLLKKSPCLNDDVEELKQLSKTRTLNHKSKNDLISYATELWEQGVTTEMFIALISQKREHMEAEDHDALTALKNLAKYPPALGMIGTVMAMVSLFSNLSSDNKDSIGAALALAMTATFFGLLVANAVVTPLADRLHVSYLKKRNYLSNVYEVLILINRSEPEAFIEDEVLHRAAA